MGPFCRLLVRGTLISWVGLLRRYGQKAVPLLGGKEVETYEHIYLWKEVVASDDTGSPFDITSMQPTRTSIEKREKA